MDGRFTDEELAIAKSVDLCAVAESLGYTVKRIGKYHKMCIRDRVLSDLHLGTYVVTENKSIDGYLSLIHI